MNTRRALALLLLALPLLLWGGAAFAEVAPPTAEDQGAEIQVRRYALVVGVNDGGPDRVQLRYAGTDALALSRVLTQLGGVHPEDAVVLLDVDRQGLSDGLDRLASLLASSEDGVRSELFFYYSGHSDEQGLLLGGDRVNYSDLREALNALPADVRIGVLDSCASGAFTRLKGGTRRTPFLVDDTGEVRGHAFLTSSSEDEASQESDRLQGSFFTYALISGLRGAADHTGDGRVSLNEVYQFAFHETLRRTESTLGGPQHPAYDIQLAGSGDLVLTDLREVSASLVLGEQLDGRITVRNSEERLELELRKFAGRPVTLGLESGGYTVTWDNGAQTMEAIILLGDGVDLELQPGDFMQVDLEATRARGAEPPPRPQMEENPGSGVHPAPSPTLPREGKRERTLRLVPFNIGLVPPLDINTWVRGPDLNHVSLFVLGGRSHAVRGVSLGAGFGWVGDMQGAQVAPVNWANTLHGVQTGVVNMARVAQGVQVGVANITGDHRGLKVGVVNVAESMDGVMVGVVNIAQDAKFAFGLLNFIKRGTLHVDAWVSDVNLVNVGVKFGARHTYTVISGGFSPVGDPHGEVSFGLGVRMPRVGPFILDLDGASGLVFGSSGWKTPAYHHQLRAIINLRLADHFGLFLGPTVNLLVGPPGRDPVSGRLDADSPGWQMRDNGSGISLLPTLTGDASELRIQVWPGGVVGISF